MCLLQLASESFSRVYYVSGPGRCINRSSRLGIWDRFPPLMASSWSYHPLLSPLPPGDLLCGIEALPRMRSCEEAFESSLPMRGKWRISPATAPQCAQLHSQRMWQKQTSLSKWPSAEQYLPTSFRAGPLPQSLLFHPSGFSSVQPIHAWLTDVAAGVYGHDRCFLLSSAIVCRELI